MNALRSELPRHRLGQNALCSLGRSGAGEGCLPRRADVFPVTMMLAWPALIIAGV
jgi:hypothetical protein